MPVQKSVVLDHALASKILDETVPLSQCTPKKLFRVRESSNGLTSDWNIVMKYLTTLSAVLDATAGKQLTYKPWTKQLKTWLADQSLEWCLADVEGCADGLRVMLRSVQSMKHGQGKPPRNYAALQVLLDKIPAKPAQHTTSQPVDNSASDTDAHEEESSDEVWGWKGEKVWGWGWEGEEGESMFAGILKQPDLLISPFQIEVEMDEIVAPSTSNSRNQTGNITRGLHLPWDVADIPPAQDPVPMATQVADEAADATPPPRPAAALTDEATPMARPAADVTAEATPMARPAAAAPSRKRIREKTTQRLQAKSKAKAVPSEATPAAQGFDLHAVLGEGEVTSEIIMPGEYREFSKAKKNKSAKTGKEAAMKAEAQAGVKAGKAMKVMKAMKAMKVMKAKKVSKPKKGTVAAKKALLGMSSGDGGGGGGGGDDDRDDDDHAEVFDPIAKYLNMEWDMVDPDKAVMVKRVHSQQWHYSRKQQKNFGQSDDSAKARASKDAHAAVRRFLRCWGLEP